MPKVQHVKAGKDYPQFGIKKGDMHYTWNLMLGPRSSKQYRQLTPPKRSQLTTSDFLGRVYDIEDRISSLTAPVDEAERDEIVQELRDLGEEQGEKYDNMPEGLQQGPTGQQLESRRDGCDSAADELEGIDLDFDEDEPEDDDEKSAWQEKKDQHDQEVLESIQNVSIDYE